MATKKIVKQPLSEKQTLAAAALDSANVVVGNVRMQDESQSSRLFSAALGALSETKAGGSFRYPVGYASESDALAAAKSLPSKVHKTFAAVTGEDKARPVQFKAAATREAVTGFTLCNDGGKIVQCDDSRPLFGINLAGYVKVRPAV